MWPREKCQLPGDPIGGGVGDDEARTDAVQGGDVLVGVGGVVYGPDQSRPQGREAGGSLESEAIGAWGGQQGEGQGGAEEGPVRVGDVGGQQATHLLDGGLGRGWERRGRVVHQRLLPPG